MRAGEWWIAIALGCLSLHASAQSIDSAATAALRALLTGAQPYPCNKSGVCETEVIVGPDQSGAKCEVYWGYSGLVVAKGIKVNLRWKILKRLPDHLDANTYSFHPTHGIKLNPEDKKERSRTRSRQRRS